jgi:maltose alpha-D-glucosyltransferase/alpha-amylase
VLFTGDDFVIIDFEGEPARSIEARRAKHCALRDVAGMLRSFSYAGHAALRAWPGPAEDRERLAPWAGAWPSWVGRAYLGAWRSALAGAAIVPAGAGAFDALLAFHQLEKVVYELEYELNNRPDWVEIPLAGLLGLVGRGQG